MDAYFLGSLVGRFVASYLLVWLVFFIFSKLNYKRAVKRLHSRWGLTATLTLFALPIVASLATHVPH